MSTHRVSPEAGWADPAQLPRGPQGRCLCRHCGNEVPPRRRTFCGDACVEQWKLKTDPSFLRSRVWKRDKGRCARCELKCRDLEKGIALLREVLARQGKSRLYGEIRKALKIQSRHSLWDADHIRAVVDGGGECGLENMQTLCLWCHREKTAANRIPNTEDRIPGRGVPTFGPPRGRKGAPPPGRVWGGDAAARDPVSGIRDPVTG